MCNSTNRWSVEPSARELAEAVLLGEDALISALAELLWVPTLWSRTDVRSRLSIGRDPLMESFGT